MLSLEENVEAQALRDQGWSISAIARHLGRDRKGLPQPATVPSIPDEGRICFWGGWGGSMVVMHPDRGLTISYVTNKMAEGIIGSDLSNAYIAAIYEGLD